MNTSHTVLVIHSMMLSKLVPIRRLAESLGVTEFEVNRAVKDLGAAITQGDGAACISVACEPAHTSDELEEVPPTRRSYVPEPSCEIESST